MSSILAENIGIHKDKLSRGEILVLAIQHVLTMVPPSIAVPLIIGSALNLENDIITFLVSTNLFTSGIATLIQVYGVGNNIGSKLPIVLGASFAPLGVMISIGLEYDLNVLFGSIIASGVLVFIFANFIEKILIFFPDVVVGSFVTVVGVSLIPVAFKDLAGGEGALDFASLENVCLGLLVLFTIVLVNRYLKGFAQSLSLLIGIVVGTIVAVFMDKVNFTPVVTAGYFELINPLKFGLPKFEVVPIFMLTIFCTLNIIQCIGVFYLYDEVSNSNTNNKTKANGLKGVALSQIFSGMFCSVPSSMFNENVGLIELTKVKERSVIKVAAVLLIIISLFPKLSALLTIIPKPVIGGATLALFGIIIAAGISILSNVDFSKNGHFTIVSISLALGVGVVVQPSTFDNFPGILSMLFSNALFTVIVVSILLNILFNFEDIKRNFDK